MGPWTELEPGLDLATIPVQTDEGKAATISLLRIDPRKLDVDVMMASSLKISPLTPKDWAETYDLIAVINASMFQGDYLTSVGYLRSGSQINNPHWKKSYGAVLVSGPGEPTRPETTILDRDADDWNDIQGHYTTVLQNPRLIDANRQLLWATHTRSHAIAALGQDTSGRLLFIHCPDPISVQEFVTTLLDQPVGLTRLMYLDGSTPAGMHLRTEKFTHTWLGENETLKFGTVAVPIPNVLVVRHRTEKR